MEAKGYIIIGGGLLVGAALAYIAINGINGAAKAAGSAAVDAAAGVVVGVGSAFGVPDTTTAESRSSCCQAMNDYAAGAIFSAPWKVMTYCDAMTYLKWAATGARPSGCGG